MGLMASSPISIPAAVIAVAFLSYSASTFSQPQNSPPALRPAPKLPKPVVILISSDGFRYDYQYKTITPHIGRLIAKGTEAYPGLIPVFPTKTFPNHYSIATGLYPAYHSIIENRFQDPVTGDIFTTPNNDPKWWLGEPTWETSANQGLRAATYFWPDTKWDCPPVYRMRYNSSVPFEDRVDTVLVYFDSPDSIPSLVNLYFQDPDSQGHQCGPDHPEITRRLPHNILKTEP